jgi:uncharacterized protein (DUF934 family)
MRVALVHRKRASVASTKTFRGRNLPQLMIKLSAWLFVERDEHPPSEYKLVVWVEPEDDPRAQKLMELLRQKGITVGNHVIEGAEIGARTI